jgi:hypothetical protein
MVSDSSFPFAFATIYFCHDGEAHRVIALAWSGHSMVAAILRLVGSAVEHKRTPAKQHRTGVQVTEKHSVGCAVFQSI